MEPRKAMDEFRKLTGITPKIDGLTSAMLGRLAVDLVALDEQFEKRDKDYNRNKCLYKGENVSMSEYAEKKWGTKAVTLIEAMI